MLLSHTRAVVCCHGTVGLTEKEKGQHKLGTDPGPANHDPLAKIDWSDSQEGIWGCISPGRLIVHRVAKVGQRCTEGLHLPHHHAETRARLVTSPSVLTVKGLPGLVLEDPMAA